MVLAEDARLELDGAVAAFRTLLLAQAISKGNVTKRSIKRAYVDYEKAIKTRNVVVRKSVPWSVLISIGLTGAGTAGSVISPAYNVPHPLPKETYVAASALLIALGTGFQLYSSRKGAG